MTCSACRVSPFRHPRIKAYVQLPAAFRSLSRLSSAPSARASALRPTMLNLLYLRPASFAGSLPYSPKWFSTCPYRRICKACPSCSLVLLAIAFSIYIRVIDSNFFYQRRGLMFDVSDLIFRSNLSLIQFSRYELYISGIYVPGVLHAISTQEPFPGCSSHAKRCIYIEKAYALLRSCELPHRCTHSHPASRQARSAPLRCYALMCGRSQMSANARAGSAFASACSLFIQICAHDYVFTNMNE